MLRAEPLEQRRLLAVITVDSLGDEPVDLSDGDVTLRDALVLAADAAYPDADEIVFDSSLGLDTTPGEIRLTEGELLINSVVTITGPGSSNLAIDADADAANESRVIYIDSAVTVSLTGLTVTHGYTTARGGGIRNEGGTLTVQDCCITDNYGKYGGGILNTGTLILQDSTLSGNSSSYGGGFRNWYGTATVIGSTITGNYVYGLGGGLSNTGTLTVEDSSISDNESLTDAGGIYNDDDGAATIRNTIISGNTAGVHGGGIQMLDGSMDLANTTVLDNSADIGGGIYGYNSTMVLTNVTVAGNTASDLAGGIYSHVATVTLANTIVAANEAATGPDAYGELAGSYSLIGDGAEMTGLSDGADGNQVGTTASPIDPLFVNAAAGNYRLLSGSPALDAGDNDLAAAALEPEDFGEILVDHNDVDITALTEAEMQAAKDTLHIVYAHTSHGSQVTTGMTGLVAFANGGGKGLSLSTGFFAYNDGGTGGALDLDDHYGDMGDVGYYPAWYNYTTAYLDDPANADVNVVMWSWCGQVDSKWAAGTLESEYLAPMAELEGLYPSVHFVYMTGHVDHWDDANNKAANEAIRDYCAANDKILYDFADIESYDPDGVYYEFPNDNCDYYESASGSKLGNWATAWQTSHTEGVDWYSCSSAHSEALNANQKAYAAWVLFSEIAALPALPDLPDMTDLDGNPRVVDGNSDGTATVDLGAYEWSGDPVDELYLDGTEDADTIIVAITAAEVTVTLNGTVTSYSPAEYSTIHFDGLGGADTVAIVGTDADEQATLTVGAVDMESDGFAFHGTNVETINVDAGGGADEVTMTGSTATCRLYSYPGRVTLSDSTRSFQFRAEGFETVEVEAPGTGRDYAFLYDSDGADRLEADPDSVVFTRGLETADETVTTVTGFQSVYAYATLGEGDEATLRGSESGRDRFYGYADRSVFTESARSFYFSASGFDDVAAESTSTATSYAYLYDSSGDDQLTATTDSATFDRAESWSDTALSGFERLYAYATGGGDDSADLTGNTAGGNRYRAYPTYATLSDATSSFYQYVRGFGSTLATGSQTDTGTDRAYLYDSGGDDLLTATLLEDDEYQGAILTDTAGSYENAIAYFDLVYARSSDSGTTDTVDADEERLAYDLLLSGTW